LVLNGNYRLYFNTDLDPMTGWLYSRGYEYGTFSSELAGIFEPVRETVASSADGGGGRVTGQASVTIKPSSVEVEVALSTIRDDGRLVWELMVFDNAGVWMGSYAGNVPH